jgi:hypothetical protein
MGKRVRQRGAWQSVFDANNRLVGAIEERGGRWCLILGKREIGTFDSREGALAFATRLASVQRGGSDGRR